MCFFQEIFSRLGPWGCLIFGGWEKTIGIHKPPWRCLQTSYGNLGFSYVGNEHFASPLGESGGPNMCAGILW